MLSIPDDIRDEAITAMQVVLLGGATSPAEHLSAEHLGEAFDAAVAVVMQRMGFA